MILLAIDPGTHETAYVGYDTHLRAVSRHGIVANEALLEIMCDGHSGWLSSHLAVEMVACYGMPVGSETFDTCVWIGRFVQAWGGRWSRVYRSDVKSHLCHSARAKDANVRQALLDRFGGKAAAVGRKSEPGPLYGIKSHCWSALAVAVTWSESEKFAAERRSGDIQCKPHVESGS